MHGQKGHGQHQRDGDAHHQTGAYVQRPAPPELPEWRLRVRALMETERQKAHGQHDHDRLDQHLHKLAHRLRDRTRLVLHLTQGQASRQGGLHLRCRLLERLAQRNDVTALGHADAQRDHFLPVVAHLDGRRVHIAAPHLGDVTEPQLRARSTTDRHGAQVVERLELPGHTHLHHILWRTHGPGGLHSVLLAHLRQHRIHVQPHLGQLAVRDFDEDFLVLHTKKFDLGHILHAQQTLAHVVGFALELGRAVTLAAQGVDHAVHITKLVIEERSHHPLRQRGAHIAHLFAHRVPDLLHITGWRVVLELENDQRLTRFGIAADLVGVRHLLQRALHLVRHLLRHLLRAGTWPDGAYHHGTEGERGIFILTQLKVGGHAQHHERHHQVACQRRVLQRPAREVEFVF